MKKRNQNAGQLWIYLEGILRDQMVWQLPLTVFYNLEYELWTPGWRDVGRQFKYKMRKYEET